MAIIPGRYRVTLITENMEAVGPVEGHLEIPQRTVTIYHDPANPRRSFVLPQERSFLHCVLLPPPPQQPTKEQVEAARKAGEEHAARVEAEEQARRERASQAAPQTPEERRTEWQQRLAEVQAKRAQQSGEGDLPACERPAQPAGPPAPPKPAPRKR